MFLRLNSNPLIPTRPQRTVGHHSDDSDNGNVFVFPKKNTKTFWHKTNLDYGKGDTRRLLIDAERFIKNFIGRIHF